MNLILGCRQKNTTSRAQWLPHHSLRRLIFPPPICTSLKFGLQGQSPERPLERATRRRARHSHWHGEDRRSVHGRIPEALINTGGDRSRPWPDKLSATLTANAGAAAHELMAQYGWTNLKQAQTYTKNADPLHSEYARQGALQIRFENETSALANLVRGKLQITWINQIVMN